MWKTVVVMAVMSLLGMQRMYPVRQVVGTSIALLGSVAYFRFQKHHKPS